MTDSQNLPITNIAKRIKDEIGDMHSSFVENSINYLDHQSSQYQEIVNAAIDLGEFTVKYVEDISDVPRLLPEGSEIPTVLFLIPDASAEMSGIGEYVYVENNVGTIELVKVGELMDTPPEIYE